MSHVMTKRRLCIAHFIKVRVLHVVYRTDNTMGKRGTTRSQATKRKGDSTTSAYKERSELETIALEDVMEIVLGNGYLHLTEILPLYCVNKAFHREVKSSPATKSMLTVANSTLHSRSDDAIALISVIITQKMIGIQARALTLTSILATRKSMTIGLWR